MTLPLASLCHLQAADESSEEAAFYEILPCCARFRCGEQIAEGQWHHLVLVMSKGMLKNSMATLYIDGQLINTVKVKLLTYVECAWIRCAVIYTLLCKEERGRPGSSDNVLLMIA